MPEVKTMQKSIELPNVDTESTKAEIQRFLTEQKMDLTKLSIQRLAELSIAARLKNLDFYDLKYSGDLDQLDRRQAAAILEHVPVRIAAERSFGRDFCVLWNIPYRDIYAGNGIKVVGDIESNWLIGASRYIYNFCVEQNLKPTLEYWDTQNAALRGHNIVIHFDAEPRAKTPSYRDIANEQFALRAGIDAIAGRDHTILFSFPAPEHVKQAGEVSVDELPAEIRSLYENYTAAGYFVSLDYWDYDNGTVEDHGYTFVVNWRGRIKEILRNYTDAPAWL